MFCGPSTKPLENPTLAGTAKSRRLRCALQVAPVSPSTFALMETRQQPFFLSRCR